MLHPQLGPVLDATKFRHPNASMRIMAKFVLGGGIPLDMAEELTVASR